MTVIETYPRYCGDNPATDWTAIFAVIVLLLVLISSCSPSYC